MEVVIQAQNVKVLSKTVQSLAKLGDDVYFEMKPKQLDLIALNANETVLARVSFYQNFFSSCEIKLDEGGTPLLCRMQLKFLVHLFRGNLEKKLKYLSLQYSSKNDYFLIEMRYLNDDTSMVHKFKLMDNDSQIISNIPSSDSNHLHGTAELYTQLISMFNSNDNEIVFDCDVANCSKITARNYSVGQPTRPNMMRTETVINSCDFFTFEIRQKGQIVLPLKPLRTIVGFADNFDQHIHLHFGKGGEPLAMILSSTTFQVNFTVSTLGGNGTGDDNISEAPHLQIQHHLNNQDESLFHVSRLVDELQQENDVGPSPPDSPQMKKLKTVFACCYTQPTNPNLDEDCSTVLAYNTSDEEGR